MRVTFIACLLVALIGLVSCGKSKQQLEEEFRQKEAAQAQAQENALKEKKLHGYQDQVIKSLKDPSSVQFRNLRFVNGKGGETLCGEINAKNSYGGYNGFHPFAVTEYKIDESQQSNVIFYDPDADTSPTNVDNIEAIFNKSHYEGTGC